jgi:hypothetical protein
MSLSVFRVTCGAVGEVVVVLFAKLDFLVAVLLLVSLGSIAISMLAFCIVFCRGVRDRVRVLVAVSSFFFSSLFLFCSAVRFFRAASDVDMMAIGLPCLLYASGDVRLERRRPRSIPVDFRVRDLLLVDLWSSGADDCSVSLFVVSSSSSATVTSDSLPHLFRFPFCLPCLLACA